MALICTPLLWLLLKIRLWTIMMLIEKVVANVTMMLNVRTNADDNTIKNIIAGKKKKMKIKPQVLSYCSDVKNTAVSFMIVLKMEGKLFIRGLKYCALCAQLSLCRSIARNRLITNWKNEDLLCSFLFFLIHLTFHVWGPSFLLNLLFFTFSEFYAIMILVDTKPIYFKFRVSISPTSWLNSFHVVDPK